MKSEKVGLGLIGAGVLGVLISFIWWAAFFQKVASFTGTSGKGSMPFECLVSSSGACGIIYDTARFVTTPYNPILFWLSALVLGIGVLVERGVIPIGDDKEAENDAAGVAPVGGGQSSSHNPHLASAHAPLYLDRNKWNALLQYDEQIAQVAAKLRPLGDKWVDQFGAAFLALNDKSYLPSIVKKIIEDARKEDEKRQEILRSKGKDSTFYDPTSFRPGTIIFGRNALKVALLPNGQVLEFDGEREVTFPSIVDYREKTNDWGEWPIEAEY
jgi:hypothetical protein